ncbi:hypothetical protein STEG23_013995 [Scotinomys teguina]
MTAGDWSRKPREHIFNHTVKQRVQTPGSVGSWFSFPEETDPSGPGDSLAEEALEYYITNVHPGSHDCEMTVREGEKAKPRYRISQNPGPTILCSTGKLNSIDQNALVSRQSLPSSHSKSKSPGLRTPPLEGPGACPLDNSEQGHNGKGKRFQGPSEQSDEE